jgi:Zn finger protein HypA/HybF involved in hydrogenase expression
MKTTVTAHERPDGTIEPSHEIEVVCANCQDPVSEEEQNTGTCTACGQPWQVSQSVNLTVTTLPAIGGFTIKIG